jgi:hypothetical protein
MVGAVVYPTITVPPGGPFPAAYYPRNENVAGIYNLTGIVGRSVGTTWMIYSIQTADRSAGAADSVFVTVAP